MSSLIELPASGLYGLSDVRGAGKTTLCRQLAEAARRRAVDVAGVLSPSVFPAGVSAHDARLAIEVEHIRAQKRRVLAGAQRQRGFEVLMGRWWFSEETLHWANQALAESCPCDLLIVDEIGPLELIEGGGWTHAVPVLQTGPYRLGVVVVRPELRARADAILPICTWLDVPQAKHMFQDWIGGESFPSHL
ncbi:MAG: nucleoside-triphosphatase [Anaerolineae bacterium]|nr:hypothetical protein [Thermoflexales bacterium]MDW8407329.1 nucleoside-triphosphatase [Anaerolineae bacterium]